MGDIIGEAIVAAFFTGVAVGVALAGSVWLVVKYVAPHIHLGWS